MNYFEERDEKLLVRAKNILCQLPHFCKSFFYDSKLTHSMLTIHDYVYDIRLFFNFLSKDIDKFKDKSLVDYNISDLNSITANHIKIFLANLAEVNSSRTINKRITTLKAFFKYFHDEVELIERNIMSKIKRPKSQDKPIIRLDNNEIKSIFDAIGNLPQKQQNYNEKLQLRDKTILMLFFSSGIRVSELVGLNVKDIDLQNKCFYVFRKGGWLDKVFMTDELAEQLNEYLSNLASSKPSEPLFKSIHKKRLDVCGVRDVVKKYSNAAEIKKKISPHKLRSTFGTNFYRQTRDIHLVASALGHKDINTTKKFYAAIDDDIKKSIASYSIF